MNTQQNTHTIGALSEIDRLGQAALDAIWEEEAHRQNPVYTREVVRLLQEHDRNDLDPTESKRIFDKLQEVLGPDSSADVVRYALREFALGNDRSQAVSAYTNARRLLTQVGAL